MNARRIQLVIAAGVVAALAVSGMAMASKTFFTATDGKTTISMALKDSGGKQKLVDFSWDGLKCGGDSFTAGLGKAIKVKKDGSFKSEQPVTGVNPGVVIDATVKGQVNQHVAKITGKLKLTGDCETKATFTATESAG